LSGLNNSSCKNYPLIDRKLVYLVESFINVRHIGYRHKINTNLIYLYEILERFDLLTFDKIVFEIKQVLSRIIQEHVFLLFIKGNQFQNTIIDKL
jgi:hypothetical protein